MVSLSGYITGLIAGGIEKIIGSTHRDSCDLWRTSARVSFILVLGLLMSKLHPASSS